MHARVLSYVPYRIHKLPQYCFAPCLTRASVEPRVRCLPGNAPQVGPVASSSGAGGDAAAPSASTSGPSTSSSTSVLCVDVKGLRGDDEVG